MVLPSTGWRGSSDRCRCASGRNSRGPRPQWRSRASTWLKALTWFVRSTGRGWPTAVVRQEPNSAGWYGHHRQRPPRVAGGGADRESRRWGLLRTASSRRAAQKPENIVRPRRNSAPAANCMIGGCNVFNSYQLVQSLHCQTSSHDPLPAPSDTFIPHRGIAHMVEIKAEPACCSMRSARSRLQGGRWARWCCAQCRRDAGVA
jgi:hypothetical protein